METGECVYGVSDLHALTGGYDPKRLRERSPELAEPAIASGIDPARCTFFLQSAVPAHADPAYVLESAAYYVETQRMIQFKEKSARQKTVLLSLFTYPALTAEEGHRGRGRRRARAAAAALRRAGRRPREGSERARDLAAPTPRAAELAMGLPAP